MRFTNVCGMLGNPNFYGDPYQEHTAEKIEQLKAMNINTVFVNIAWSRPWIDAVNLENTAVSASFPLLSDMEEVERHRRSLGARVGAVKAAGLQAFALFGIPRYFDFAKYPDSYGVLKGSTLSTISPGDSVACVRSPEVRRLYRELFADLLAHMPELDGMQVYTYDELAEVCDEASDCPRCRGIPADERIPAFLNGLHEDLQALKPGFELWWEPWELSAAQTYRITERLDPAIGLALHSTLHEVYFVNETDQWFRNLAAIASDQGRKVVGEIFAGGSGEDLGNIAGYPSPRLVYRQIQALARVPGVTGMKEYFGFPLEYASVNEETMRLVAQDPYRPWDGVEDALADAYAADEDGRRRVRRFWEYAARAVEFIPWELSWVLRFGNLPPYAEYWGARFVDLFKTPWSTPSWLSNRRSFYLVVEGETNFTTRMQLDLIERFRMAADWLERAAEEAGQTAVREAKRAGFGLQREAVAMLGHMVKCRLHHLELSYLADRLRAGQEETDADAAARRIASLLDAELDNARRWLQLLQHSDVPYTFRGGDGSALKHETIAATVKRIEEAKGLLEQGGRTAWLARYF